MSLLKQIAYKTITPALYRGVRKNQGIIGLSYHRFEPNSGSDPRPNMAMSKEGFKQHIEALKKRGEFIAIDDALNKIPSEKLRFILSFDDGYEDNLTTLLPLLEQYQVPVCIYVVSDFIEGKIQFLPHDAQTGYWPQALDTRQLVELSQHPLVTIGAHTVSHRLLNTLTPHELHSELKNSKDQLEQLLQTPVRHFAAPSGQPNEIPYNEIIDPLFESGYRTLSSNFGGYNRGQNLDELTRKGKKLTHLYRIPMTIKPEAWVAAGWAAGFQNLKRHGQASRHLETAAGGLRV